jgi:Putative Tad-like Flp pilus-assembly
MKRCAARRSDSGTIAVTTAIMLPILFGMAALAVDVGFLYTRSRMIYAVADSAVAVGMRDLMSGAGNATITADVNDIAGKYGGSYTITPLPGANQVQVTVTATYPLFFSSAFGLPSKQLTVVAIGKRGASTPPILATGAGCGNGVTINGVGVMTVNGDIQSNGGINFADGPTGPIINGSVLAAPACGPTPPPASQHTWDVVTGTYGTGGPFSDPFTPYVVPSCDHGGVGMAYTIAFTDWDMSTTPPTLPAGTYCSNANLLLSSPGSGFTATGVTLISIGGTININASTASIITPNSKSPNGVVAYSTAGGGCAPGAIFLGGPSGELMTVGGALYAPNGCVNVAQNGPMTMTSAIGSSVDISNFSPWTIGTGGGGSSTAWQMSQ